MKTSFRLFTIIFIISSGLILLSNCKKEKNPVVNPNTTPTDNPQDSIIIDTIPIDSIPVDTIVIIDTLPFEVSYVVTNVSGHLINDGSIDLTINGGVPPYKVNWMYDTYIDTGYYNYVIDTLSHEEDIFDLQTGYYLLEVFDQIGNSFVDSVFLASRSKILPDDYYPVYPGSVWEYDDGSVVHASEDYLDHDYYRYFCSWPFCHNEQANTYPYDKIKVPYYGETPIYKNHRMNSSISKHPNIPLWLDNVDEYYIYNTDTRLIQFWVQTLNLDTAMTINGHHFEHVIKAIDGWGEVSQHSHYYEEYDINYYAKGVGLVKTEHWEKIGSSGVTTTKAIKNWNINMPQ